MRTSTNLFLAALVLGFALVAPSATAQSWTVIVHPDNPTTAISKSEAADYFLKRKTRWGHGPRIEPAEYVGSQATREAFCEDVVGRSISALEAHWQQQIFSGRGVPPARFESENEILDYVAQRPGAIAFVSTKPTRSDVRSLDVE